MCIHITIVNTFTFLYTANNIKVMGDPHFMVPLLSGQTLCYSIQGYPGLAFNLISNEDYVINALFIDSIGDEKEATWIGKLAVIPKHANESQSVIFDSGKQEVILVDQGHFRASIIDKISYDKNGKMSVKFTRGIAKQAGNPKIHIKYEKPLASFDITFYNNHLDVDWDIKYDRVSKIHGLMGMLIIINLHYYVYSNLSTTYIIRSIYGKRNGC